MIKSGLHRDLGKVLAISGDLEGACARYQRALEGLQAADGAGCEGTPAAEAAGCHLDLASCLLGLERWAEALKHCELAEDQAGEDDAVRAKALFRRGQTLYRLGLREEAAADMETALSLGSDEDVWQGVMEDELQRVLGSLEASDGLAPIQEEVGMPASQRGLIKHRSISTLTPWIIARDDIKLLNKMSAGGFGQVYIAEWHMTKVAAKRLNMDSMEGDGVSEEVLTNLKKEASLMSSLHHPNIVSFLGFCLDPPIILMELCGKDSLTAVLDRGLKNPGKAAELTWKRRLDMLLDAAKGILYLHRHNPPVLHRDLKSPNLLVDDFWRVKVADFNLSRLVEIQANTTSLSSSSNASRTMDNVNPRWLAPEILMGENATVASDVYAFGLVMWEILTWQVPWAQHRFPIQIIGCLMSGKRPEIPSRDQMPGPDNDTFDRLDQYVGLLQRCWAEDPAQRPPFETIITELREMAGE